MMVWDVTFPYSPSSKHVATKILFKLKITWNGVIYITCEQGTRESILKVDGISSIHNSTKVREFGNSTSFVSLGNTHW